MPSPSFTPPDTDFTRPFWDAIASRQLRLPRCAACGAWQWYPLPGVTHCPGAPIAWTQVRPEGVVFTFTVMRRPFLPDATLAEVPMTSIMVELDDAPGVRLVGRLTDGAEPRIGMSVAGESVAHEGRCDLQWRPLGA